MRSDAPAHSQPTCLLARCEGRKSYAEGMPETVTLAKELHGRGLSYRKISAELANRGHVTRTGKPHVASAVQKMLGT